jgi:hypothetical protein
MFSIFIINLNFKTNFLFLTYCIYFYFIIKVITREDINKDEQELLSCQVNGSKESAEDQVITKQVYKRSKIRKARKLAVKRYNAEREVLKARKMVSLMNKKGPELEAAILQNKLGAAGCISCRKKKCNFILFIYLYIYLLINLFIYLFLFLI